MLFEMFYWDTFDKKNKKNWIIQIPSEDWTQGGGKNQ